MGPEIYKVRGAILLFGGLPKNLMSFLLGHNDISWVCGEGLGLWKTFPKTDFFVKIDRKDGLAFAGVIVKMNFFWSKHDISTSSLLVNGNIE
jgi:hypothetical protein